MLNNEEAFTASWGIPGVEPLLAKTENGADEGLRFGLGSGAATVSAVAVATGAATASRAVAGGFAGAGVAAADAEVDVEVDAAEVSGLLAQAAELLRRVPPRVARRMSDEGLLGFAGDSEEVGRLVDALRLASVGEVAERSRAELGAGTLSTKKGCRSAVALLERVSRVSASTASRRIRLAEKLRTGSTLTGGVVPPVFPLVAAAVDAGTLGVDGAEAILAGLAPAVSRAAPGALVAAESELVAAATGTSAVTPVPSTPDEVRMQAHLWRGWIDPDGVRPNEERAMLARGLRFGRERDGLIPISGALMPEIAAKAQRLFGAHQAPASAPVAFPSVHE
jgi:hypothetical protein